MYHKAHLSQGNTWAKYTWHLLNNWGLLDWPTWYENSKADQTYSSYVFHTLRRTCYKKWVESVSNHVWPIPYLDLQPSPTNLFRQAFKLGIVWDTLLHQTALSKIRCGYVALGHNDGKPSRARVQTCIFCGRRYTSVQFHVICRCSTLSPHRDQLTDAGFDCSSMKFLGMKPSEPMYELVAAFAAILANQAASFWK